MPRIRVCSAEELESGKVRRVDHAGTHFAVGNDGGRFFGMDGICSHADGELYAGWIEDACLVCPLHKARFDTETGKVGPPPPAATDLAVYDVTVEDGEVFVTLPD